MAKTKPQPRDFSAYFATLDDPRQEINQRHKLIDIVVLAVCAAICGADKWTDVESFAKAKEEWYRQFLDLPSGIPSHDTFGRVFAHLDPEAFQEGLLNWLGAVFDLDIAQQIAIDGKTARRSGDQVLGKKALHMVSAWALDNQVVLGQVKTDDKSNEITAIPALLAMLDIEDCVISIDAMGCQKDIAEQIIDGGGDYVLGLKGNQGGLLKEAEALFDEAYGKPHDDVREATYRTTERGHGREEVREYQIMEDLFCSERRRSWKGLRCFGRVISTRTVKGKTSTEIRYYATSLRCHAKAFGKAVRSHWGIENSLHWSLDMAFREDESRVRKDHGATNMSILYRFALSLLKNERTHKRGIQGKRLLAGWDNAYLLKVLGVARS